MKIFQILIYLWDELRESLPPRGRGTTKWWKEPA